MASEFCAQTESIKANIRLAIQKRKPGPPPYQVRTMVVALSQDVAGNWGVSLNRGRVLPATDAEVCLWQEVQFWKRRAMALGNG